MQATPFFHEKFHHLLMVVENAVSSTAPESPISVQLGLDLVTEMAVANGFMVFMLIKPFSDHSYTVDGGIVILWGIAMVAKIMACPAFLYMNTKHDGDVNCLINSRTTPVWNLL